MIIALPSVGSQGLEQEARVELRQLEARDPVRARVGLDRGPLLELLAAREPVRPLERRGLALDDQLPLDAVHAPRVAAEQLRLHRLRYADRAHLAHRAPRIGAVVVVGVARPQADVLEEIPLAERRRLVRLEG